MERGTYKFELSDDHHLINNGANVQRLRRLWLDRQVINGDNLGPGDPGDFDNGAWHVACHLAGGCGVKRLANGGLAWLEISHNPATDRYFASVTALQGFSPRTVPIDSAEGIVVLRDSVLLGFVEGTSLGRTSARLTNDSPELFNLWRRADFDQPPGTTLDGGRVWEHWCTLRDIRPTHAIGTSMLTAFVSLIAALGDHFLPTVARGRRDYGHPVQLRAMVQAGLIGRQAALWKGTPNPIPRSSELMLEEADPATSLKAISSLDWSKHPRYYMFERKIASWSKVADVKKDLK
jgi:hypothetical protein